MITVAKNAGFCFGVKRAVDTLLDAIENKRPGERIYTLGTLIHNGVFNAELEQKGVKITSEDELCDLAKGACESSPVTVFLRAHGVPKETEELLERLSSENESFRYVDCACPFVKKIHNIAKKHSAPDKVFLLFGKEDHPEVVGIMSYFDYEKITFNSADELLSLAENGYFVKINNKIPVLASQTTQNLAEWKKSQEILKNYCTNSLIFDTICSVTEERQLDAERLSKECDAMIVIGGKNSSNTAKLFSVCKRNCPETVWIERADELTGDNLISCAHTKLGIAAGASTPLSVIQEVHNIMSEKMNFEQMLDESLKTTKTLNKGDIVTGIVTYVSDAEIQLDLGAQVTGIITPENISDDPSIKLTALYKKGDTIEARIWRLSDVDGIAELSKKTVDHAKEWQAIVAASESGEVLTGKVIEVVNGGVNVLVGATKIFVPAYHSGVPKDGDLNSIKGNEVSLRIIEIKGNRAKGSIRVVSSEKAKEARKAAEEAFWSNIEEGKVYTGKVKNMTAYGAFVDLGGVDGMVHKSELSWKPIASPASVLSIGQEITVFIKEFDAEKKRISLGYKTEDTNPWNVFNANYAVGDVVSVKVVSLMPFGAFAEIVDGVDGLIHVSQIAQQKIAKPADILSVGQVVDAKIIAVDEEKQNISLSIKALLDEADAEAAAMPEEYADAPVEE
ncbi:MAG: 4-hydroxy-3-methylbut-2-enyl diphosphate reductase [Clostridia bacterium]|nr:4-hydroxy-3-methylbut-2-enyl diphosphate reductase [Clostridia bacterium]